MADSMDDLIEFQGEIWTRRELFAEAFRLLDRVDEHLAGIKERCEARLAFDSAMKAV